MEKIMKKPFKSAVLIQHFVVKIFLTKPKFLEVENGFQSHYLRQSPKCTCMSQTLLLNNCVLDFRYPLDFWTKTHCLKLLWLEGGGSSVKNRFGISVPALPIYSTTFMELQWWSGPFVNGFFFTTESRYCCKVTNDPDLPSMGCMVEPASELVVTRLSASIIRVTMLTARYWYTLSLWLSGTGILQIATCFSPSASH